MDTKATILNLLNYISISAIIGYFFGRDHNAITQCRKLLPKLSDSLEALQKHLDCHRDVQKDLPKLIEIKEAARALSVEEKKLWFSSPDLKSKLQETIRLFDRLNPEDNGNLSNNTTGISVQLLMLYPT